MEHQKNKESRLAEFSQNPEKALWKLAIPMMFGMMASSGHLPSQLMALLSQK